MQKYEINFYSGCDWRIVMKRRSSCSFYSSSSINKLTVTQAEGNIHISESPGETFDFKQQQKSPYSSELLLFNKVFTWLLLSGDKCVEFVLLGLRETQSDSKRGGLGSRSSSPDISNRISRLESCGVSLPPGALSSPTQTLPTNQTGSWRGS